MHSLVEKPKLWASTEDRPSVAPSWLMRDWCMAKVLSGVSLALKNIMCSLSYYSILLAVPVFPNTPRQFTRCARSGLDARLGGSRTAQAHRTLIRLEEGVCGHLSSWTVGMFFSDLRSAAKNTPLNHCGRLYSFSIHFISSSNRNYRERNVCLNIKICKCMVSN